MASPLAPTLPLIAYAEALCRGARVLLVGDAQSELPERLLERGARLVHVCDSDAGRRAEAQARSVKPSLSFGSIDDGPASLRDGFFDFAFVADLASERDSEGLLRTVKRLLTPRGTVLVAARNPDVTRPLLGTARTAPSLDYYALYDAVTAVLPEVRMVGQVPFVGYAVIDFSAESEPSPVLDASLVPGRGEEPDYFVAIGSRERRTLDEYAIIQLPTAAVLAAAPEPVTAPAATASPAVAPPPVVAAPPVPVREPAVPPPPVPPAPDPLIAKLEQQLAKQEAWITELEGRAATADERADAAESELDELKEALANRDQAQQQREASLHQERDTLAAEVENLRRRVNDIDDQLELRTAELATMTTDLAAVTTDLAAVTTDLATARADLATARADFATATTESVAVHEVERLEVQLREQSRERRKLELDLREAERTGRELVRKLGAPERVAASGHEPLAQLAEQLAQAEAEVTSLRWSLQLVAVGGLQQGAPTTQGRI